MQVTKTTRARTLLQPLGATLAIQPTDSWHSIFLSRIFKYRWMSMYVPISHAALIIRPYHLSIHGSRFAPDPFVQHSGVTLIFLASSGNICFKTRPVLPNQFVPAGDSHSSAGEKNYLRSKTFAGSHGMIWLGSHRWMDEFCTPTWA